MHELELDQISFYAFERINMFLLIQVVYLSQMLKTVFMCNNLMFSIYISTWYFR